MVSGCKELGCDWPARAAGRRHDWLKPRPRQHAAAGLATDSQSPPPARTADPARGARGQGRGPQGRARSGNMAAADLLQIPDVDIDSDGVFKYVLIRVHAAPPSGAPAGESKEIVRGYKWAEYHGEGWAGPPAPVGGASHGCGAGPRAAVGGGPLRGLTLAGPEEPGSCGHGLPRPTAPSPSAPAQAHLFSIPPQPGGAPELGEELLRAGASDTLGPECSHS